VSDAVRAGLSDWYAYVGVQIRYAVDAGADEDAVALLRL